MKNKSGHHKSTNRFKFTTFADRVNSIDLRRSALYHLEHANVDVPEVNETHFHNTVLRWKVLNLTAEYIEFSKFADPVVTLPQLLHKKERIIESILKRLDTGDSLNLQPFLEILVSLARDLQEEFYVHFPKFLESLVKLLNTKDPEQLEWTLICLAFLFKHLRKFLRRDISIILKSILPLLSESTKWYVRNFAAESFAFVARDVKDKKKFLETILKAIQADEELTTGCGHLLFEVIKGVEGQYHSCSEQFLPILFEALRDKAVNKKVLFEVLTQTVGDMLEAIHPRFSKTFWNAIIDSINACFTIHEHEGEAIREILDDNHVSLEYMLRLIGQCLEYKNGKFLTDSSQIVKLVNNLVDAKLSESNYQTVSQIGVLLLLCTHITLPHESAVYVTKKLLSIPHLNIVTNFVTEVVACSSFDIIVFPHFIDTIKECNEDIVKALSKICLEKSSLCKNGSDLYSWVKYPIDFGNKTESFFNLIDKVLRENIESILIDPDNFISALICLPHMKNIDLNAMQKNFECLLSKLIAHLKSLPLDSQKFDEISNALFLMAITFESAVHTINFESLEKIYDMDDLVKVLEPFILDDRYVCSLRILDLLFTLQESEHALKHEVFLQIYPLVEKKLTSPFHEQRLLATHICSLFEITLPDICDGKDKSNAGSLFKKESFKTFSLCYTAESVPISVEGYREQLLKLSKVVYDSVQYKLSKDKPFKLFSLKYLFGFLHMNFKLLWEPTQNFILTFANGLTANEFWDIYSPCLVQVTETLRNGNITNSRAKYSGKCQLLDNVFNGYCGTDENVDYNLYRTHLLEILSQATNICEVKNRDITALFLEFLNIEYYNIKPSSDSKELSIKSDNVDFNVDEEPDEDEVDVKTSVSKYTYDALLAYLKIYTRMQNPKGLFKEPELRSIYYEFLMHKNPVIQKVALDCLMAYKNKHWNPYKEHLYNLVDGKKFKEELRVFKVAEDNEIVKHEDRTDLMPIVLRIVFSKMISNIGIDKKGGSQLRRSLVVRFLAGCEENELLMFIEMAFKVYMPYVNLELPILHRAIYSLNDASNILSPKQLVGSVNLVETMRDQLIKPGEVNVLPRLLKIIFCIGTFIDKILTSQENQKSGYMSILKNIRNLCLQSLGHFFHQFHEWAWTEEELLYVHKIFVWPIIEKLPIEGIHSPTALLKLFNTWSIYPRYHNIFGLIVENSEHATLHFVLELLNNNKIHHSVNDMCMLIIERLLTLEHEGNDFIEFSKCKTVPLNIHYATTSLNLNENINIGSCVMLPCVPKLVDIFKNKFENISPKKLTKRDLNIISRLTDIISDKSSVDVFLKLSLPILIQKIGTGSSEDNYDSCIEALAKLLNKTSDPRSHMKTIIPLFSKVNTPQARKQLCESMRVLISQNEVEEKDIYSIAVEVVTEMNATDEKWIDQADYSRRLAIYKKIYEMFDADLLNGELAALIVHNSFYTIAHSDDLSLRSNASTCMQKILPALVMKFKDDEFFIQSTVIYLVKNGIKSENENLKSESITILGELVRQCPNGFSSFSELHPLSNKNDREVDFFDNLVHLQTHRKTRAFLKFCNYVKTSPQVPSSKTLMLFVMPLATQYVCNEKFVEKYSLVEAAIDTIGVICRLLPWHQYEAVLKNYLGKLHKSSDHQKQIIKLLSIILDAFHFDLSKATNVEEIMANVYLGKNKLDEDVKVSLNDTKMEVDNETGNADIKATLPYESVQTLSPSAAKRVIYVITSDILIQLDWSSAQALDHEATHKSLKKEINMARESDEKLRIPMGFAIVKLLQKLPHPMLANNISSIIIKVCNFLKSPLVNIRASAREIISKIMIAVGTAHFNILLNHLTTLLTKGFQVHVLISTVHTVLQDLKDKFSPGEMDKHLESIIKVCLNDLFGQASEEKDVVKLGNKAPEAKPSKKSYLTLRIIAQNISDSSIVRLLSPFKSILEKTHSKRVVLKIETAFQHVSLGLVENANLRIESLLIFLCGLLSDNIPKLAHRTKKVECEITLEQPKPAKPDCFLIAPDPKGSKKVPKARAAQTCSQANAHVVMEFALNVLHVVLQKEKLNSTDVRPYLDPMVPFVVDSLKSPQVRIVTQALKCTASLVAKNFHLPALKANVGDALESIFAVLHKYSTSGLSKKDENFHLVSNAFKTVTGLVRSSKYYTFDVQQITTLLMYIEHDIHDYEKQATAFSLFKAILSAKYNVPEIKEIIKKVATISIVNESPRSREESSQVMILYLLNYPSEKQLKTHIDFYVSQLSYELDQGRIAAIKILISMIDGFTKEIVTSHSAFLYVSLGMRLLTEPSEECRSDLCLAIDKILLKVDTMKRNELISLTTVLLVHKEPINIELGAHLITRFVTVEKESFKPRLASFLPKISEKLFGSDPNVGRFVKIVSKESKKGDTDLSYKDSTYVQLLKCVLTLAESCPMIFSEEQYESTIDEIGINVQSLLGHSNLSVRIHSGKFLLQFLQSLQLEKLRFEIGSEETERYFLRTEESIKNVFLDFISQLVPGEESEDLISIACDNILHLLKVVNSLPTSDNQIEKSDEESHIDVYWIVKKLKSTVNLELVKSPTITILRMAIFNIFENLPSFMSGDKLKRVAQIIMPSVVRELTKSDARFERLKEIAARVGSAINNKLGNALYNEIIAAVQAKILHKRKERKIKIAQDKINDPVKAAKRKSSLREQKKNYKKRKMDKIKGRMPKHRVAAVASNQMDID